jgi:hypothetical protein
MVLSLRGVLSKTINLRIGPSSCTPGHCAEYWTESAQPLLPRLWSVEEHVAHRSALEADVLRHDAERLCGPFLLSDPTGFEEVTPFRTIDRQEMTSHLVWGNGTDGRPVGIAVLDSRDSVQVHVVLL